MLRLIAVNVRLSFSGPGGIAAMVLFDSSKMDFICWTTAATGAFGCGGRSRVDAVFVGGLVGRRGCGVLERRKRRQAAMPSRNARREVARVDRRNAEVFVGALGMGCFS